MKQLKKDIMGMTTAGLTLGVGTLAIDKMGGDSSGLKAVGGFMPVMGTMVGAKAVMGQVGSFGKVGKKYKKK